MNQVQRKFLIDRIQTKTKERITEIEKTKLEYPSASNYIFKAVLNQELKLQGSDTILAALRNKALAAKEGENWLSNERMGYNKERTIQLLIEQLIVLPDDYYKELERVKDFNKSLTEQISQLKLQLETIEVRIQLASDKTLQNLINDVDDMGDIKLIDTKMKLLN